MGSLTGKGLEIDKSDLKNALGQPPPEGLVPIGDAGIYISPHVKEDKPVSPFDCENYPDSPYCGGQPFTKTPVGIDLEFTGNQCGVSVTGTPILGFTKLPPISVAWIAPGCRKEYDAKRKTPTPLPPPPDIGDIPPADGIPGGFDQDDIVCCVIATRRFEQGTDLKPIYNEQGFVIRYEKTANSSHYHTQLLEVEHPTTRTINLGGTTNYPLKFWAKIKFTASGGWSGEEGEDAYEVELFVRVNQPKQQTGNYWLMPPRPPLSDGNYYQFDWTSWEVPGEISWEGGVAIVGRFGSIFPTGTMYQASGSSVINENIASSFWQKTEVLYISLLDGSPKHPPYNPDDYKKRKCCEMPCCDSGQAQQRQRDQDNYEILALLREINKKLGNFPVKVNIFDANENEPGAQSKTESLGSVAQSFSRTIAEIEKALKCIGIDQLPIYAPSSIIDDESNGILGDLNDLKNQIFKQRIESIAEMMIWRAKNDNEIFGKWQETITIEDSDPTKKGNQPKKIVLPNMARTFRELVLLNSTQIKVQGMMFDTLLKLYIDVANTKISTATCEAILRDVQDYLDYPTEVKALDVPLGISIPSDNTPNDDKEDLERFLRNSIAKSKFDDWTGEGSMTEMLTLLLRMAEGYLGQNFGKI